MQPISFFLKNTIKKQGLYVCLFLCAFSFCFQKPAFAHFPATDGDMTVTLHVDPNDDPTPGKQAYLYFLFTDTTNRFMIANCTCTVSVTELGQKTHTQRLSALQNSKPSVWGTSMSYVFPERNVYYIVLTGNPNTPNAFQPFTVSWYFRVDTINPGIVQVQQRPPDREIILSALGVGIVVFSLPWFVY